MATTPVPAIFDGFSYPPGYSDFFHQNDRQGCTLDCLDGLGHFPFGFGSTGKNYRRVVTPLGKTTVNHRRVSQETKKILLNFYIFFLVIKPMN